MSGVHLLFGEFNFQSVYNIEFWSKGVMGLLCNTRSAFGNISLTFVCITGIYLVAEAQRFCTVQGQQEL